MKEQILKLRSEGKTYNQIIKILRCSKGTVSYNCGQGQKQKSILRQQKNRKERKLDKEIRRIKREHRCNEIASLLVTQGVAGAEPACSAEKPNKCLNCGTPVRLKYCSVSCQNRHQKKGIPMSRNAVDKSKITKAKKWKIFKVKCYKCELEFEIEECNVRKPKKEKYFCSRKCANSRIWTKEDKDRKSRSAKKSEKVKEANKQNTNKQIGKRKGINKNSPVMPNNFCLLCEKIIINKSNYKKSKYHRECWDKISGGNRQGSSRGKHGWYKGYWCDSSYELAFVIYCLEHGSNIERNKLGFDYIFKDKKSKYYPDFIVDSKYVEIKNYKSEITNAKINQFPYPISILYKEDIKREILPYVIEKYGKKFIELYEGNPYKLIDKNCLNCGKTSKNKYCSQSCATKYNKRKFSKDQVNEIRLDYKNGTTQIEISKKFGLSQTSISEIVRGKTYSEI